MKNKIVKTYETKLDNKKRMTVRKSKYEHYKVSVFQDGHVLLSPQMLVSPGKIARSNLKIMDESVKNFKKGKVSKPIDFKKYF